MRTSLLDVFLNALGDAAANPANFTVYIVQRACINFMYCTCTLPVWSPFESSMR